MVISCSLMSETYSNCFSLMFLNLKPKCTVYNVHCTLYIHYVIRSLLHTIEQLNFGNNWIKIPYFASILLQHLTYKSLDIISMTPFNLNLSLEYMKIMILLLHKNKVFSWFQSFLLKKWYEVISLRCCTLSYSTMPKIQHKYERYS